LAAGLLRTPPARWKKPWPSAATLR
jgi:hypothetical protein